jgi:DNA invertase Pin-like site-specific DNA recombinase
VTWKKKVDPEKEEILALLWRTGGRQSELARFLEISLMTLFRRLRELGISREEVKRIRDFCDSRFKLVDEADSKSAFRIPTALSG